MKIGIIGLGNIGSAFYKGCCKAGYQSLTCYDRNASKVKSVTGVNPETNQLVSICQNSDLIVIAIKNNDLAALLQQILPLVSETTPLLLTTVGIDSEWLIRHVPPMSAHPMVRIIPNINIMSAHSHTGIAYLNAIDEAAQQRVETLLAALGTTEHIDDAACDAFASLYASIPAYLGIFLSAMVDASEHIGFIRETPSYQTISNIMIQTLEMMNETHQHPAVIKDLVCSPSGITIEGINEMEYHKIRSVIIKSFTNSYMKSKDIKTQA
jgi:pyrroline-5-carboxylate reductase